MYSGISLCINIEGCIYRDIVQSASLEKDDLGWMDKPETLDKNYIHNFSIHTNNFHRKKILVLRNDSNRIKDIIATWTLETTELINILDFLGKIHNSFFQEIVVRRK